MKRRNLIISIGAVGAAGAAVGTGAFTSVEANRDITVDVAGDAEAFLRLEPTDEPNGDYADLEDDLLVLNFDGSAEDVDGKGFNADATTVVDDVFTVTNQGTQDVGLEIDKGGTDENVDVDFVAQIPTDEDSLVEDGPVLLEVGESFNVGLEVTTTGSETLEGAIEDDEITIIADAAESDGDDTGELQPVQNVTQGEGFDSIDAAVDGADENDTIQVASGTYNESVTIGVDGLTLESVEKRAATIEGDIFVGNDPSSPQSANGTVIDGFKIVEPELDGDGQGIGVTKSSDVVIQNNEFEGFRTQISMDYAGSAVEDITIQDNTFSDVNEDDGTAIGSTENVDGLDILNNEFINNRNDIGTADSTENVTIEGNEFTAGESDGYMSIRAVELSPQTVLGENEFDPEAVIIDFEEDNKAIVVGH